MKCSKKRIKKLNMRLPHALLFAALFVLSGCSYFSKATEETLEAVDNVKQEAEDISNEVKETVDQVNEAKDSVLEATDAVNEAVDDLQSIGD